MISLIVACSKNNVIGNNNKLLWNLKDDMEYFKKVTTDNIVIMGRKTFESIGKPLPNRYNIVISKTLEKKETENLKIVNNFDCAINCAINYQKNKDIFIIGGGQVYKEALCKPNLVNRIYVTKIEKDYEGDTYFPKIKNDDFKIIWEKKVIYPMEHKFLIYEKIK